MNQETFFRKFYKDHLSKKIPAKWEATALLQGFSFLRVPLLFSVRPIVTELSDKKSVVKIPLRRWTKNHLGSMYFGAMAIGADAVVGILALHFIRKKSDHDIHLSFKDFRADFIKRPESDVYFVCEDGARISSFVEKVQNSRERMNLTVPAHAIAAKSQELVAKFELTLSLKKRGK